MRWAYVLEVQGKEERDNTPIFQKIIELDIEGDNIRFDMSGRPQAELQRLVDTIAPQDDLYIRSVLDLSDSIEGAVSPLSALSDKQVALHSCLEPILDGSGYYDTIQQVRQLITAFSQKKQKTAYNQALQAGKVGRPAKLTEEKKQEVISLHKEKGLSIKQIQVVTGLSRSTVSRYLKG